MTTPTPQPPQQPVPKKIMISAETYTLRGKPIDTPIQRKPFILKLKITNIDNTVSPECTIRNCQLKSPLKDQTLYYPIPAEFAVTKLNPGESTEITLSKHFMTTYHGMTWFTLAIEPNDPSFIIKAHRSHTDLSPPYPTSNEWGNEIYIQSHMEYLQHRTNVILVFIAALALLEGIFGLQEIMLAFWHAIQWVFLKIGNLGG